MNLYKKEKNVVVIAITLISVLFICLKLYQIYAGIEIKDTKIVEAERLSETVVETEKNDKTVTEMLSSATKCVVGISKLKNNGDTVFMENGISQMGIGSRNYYI